MALRAIRMLGDEILTKSCREVTEMTPRLQELVEDMLETMYDADGVGLAAPQVGVLRQIVVIDIWQDGIVETKELKEGEEPEEGETSETEAAETDAASGEECEPSEQPNRPAPPKTTLISGESDESEDYEEDDGEEWEGPLIMVNPIITKKEGTQTADEGCLSFPGKVGRVTRPAYIEVTYFDENMDEYELEAEGLLARAICHEVDHLSGHMYVEFVEGEIRDAGSHDSEDEDEEEEEEEE